MESIYGENIFILNNENGLRSFQIRIHIEAPEELTISTKLNTNTNNSDDFSYSFQVKYIPPIILTCLLPKSYPTHLPPYFTISVQWLDSVRISSLCSMLDSIWNEQHGQEVIYSWAEWLHSSAISYLGFDKEIILGPYGRKDRGDPRAISGCVSADVDIPSLKSYNEEQRLESFLTNLQECCICFSEFAGSEFIRLPCQHFFCEKCMKTYSDVLIQEGSVNKLLCPITKCGGMIPPGLIKRWLGDEEFERWESLTLQKTLESMTDVVYCPRCETPCIEEEDQHAQCTKCFFNFCTLCREKRHVGIMCLTPEMKLRILQERQGSGQMGDKQRRREQEMIQELLSVKEILRDAKQCPSCKMAISKTEGCNKMVCQNCGKYFCYLCNKAIDGYDHFRSGTCELFPQQEVMNWEERMNPRQLVAQIQAELYAELGHTCPQCGQNNVKIGNNNHIFCWACQGHYCYLCRKIVRRGSQHFGPKGCKQHTVG
ncbi:NDR1/HIN1-like 8 [Artemisia annua]|nr:NDR1/HIN1-like 8 [Artemisia annua]